MTINQQDADRSATWPTWEADVETFEALDAGTRGVVLRLLNDRPHWSVVVWVLSNYEQGDLLIEWMRRQPRFGRSREDSVRRRAKACELRLSKSRQAATRGTYQLTNGRTGALVAGVEPTGFGLSLSEVEAALDAHDGGWG